MNKDLRVENMGHHRNKNSGGQFWNQGLRCQKKKKKKTGT